MDLAEPFTGTDKSIRMYRLIDFGEIKCQKNLMKNMKNAADGEMHGMRRCGSAKRSSR